MSDEKLRLGGMALANGVLVHGPKSWACAIRTEDGQLKVAAQRKRQWASKVESPFLRGPARLLDAMAIIPQIRRALPEAKLPFQRPAVRGGDGRQRHGRKGPARLSLGRPGDPGDRQRPALDRTGRTRPPQLRTLPRITAPSTSPSAPTSKESAQRRSTAAADRT